MMVWELEMMKEIQFLTVFFIIQSQNNQMDSESSQSIEDQRNDENFLSYMQNSEKKTRKKFTILDDLDELNERINGPGANEDQQKTKQIIQETFKNSHHPLSKSIEQPERPSISPPPSAQKKQLHDPTNNLKQSQLLVENLKKSSLNGQVTGLISFMMKIDLSKPPTDDTFWLGNEENIGVDMCMAPRNSFKKSQYDLFSQVLETERNKGKKISHYRC